ncbi:aminoglycoside phosphotransferase family protein [Kribbella sp. NPDC026611]|uniref:aminoglycoside phosphotransferase family protein n=1 Tax=Kribbella sp. NPDC026611 TaxID=3154911 RepID=UPI0033DB6DB3
MTQTPDLGPVPVRVAVETEQVRRLVATQFPEWAGLPVEPVAKGGWDNWTFHLGTELVVRLPSAAEYAEAVEKEHRWLPVLAPQLPLTIPVPVSLGKPTADYPHPWSIYRWLDGVTATSDRIADPEQFALDLAGFLAALQSVDATDGPQPGIHNWYRGGTLRTYDKLVQQALEELDGYVDVALARQIWTDALASRWDGVDRWFHGDVAEGNLLLADGRLTAIIDFGTCGVGDPSCDLAIAWTLLTPTARTLFRNHLSTDNPTWSRGQGWALWKALATALYTYQDPAAAPEFQAAHQTLTTIFTAYTTT